SLVLTCELCDLLRVLSDVRRHGERLAVLLDGSSVVGEHLVLVAGGEVLVCLDVRLVFVFRAVALVRDMAGERRFQLVVLPPGDLAAVAAHVAQGPDVILQADNATVLAALELGRQAPFEAAQRVGSRAVQQSAVESEAAQLLDMQGRFGLAEQRDGGIDEGHRARTLPPLARMSAGAQSGGKVALRACPGDTENVSRRPQRGRNQANCLLAPGLRCPPA